MSDEFLLLRHGKSDWSVDCPDISRPLKKRGQRDAERIGAWLWQHECIPTSIISSPATRAQQTAHWCARAMGINPQRISLDGRLYMASPATLLEVLAERLADAPGPASQRPLLVGHNPGMEQLIEQLSDTPPPYPDDGKLLPTASLAWFKLLPQQQLPELQQTELKQLVRARELPRAFPFRGMQGLEWRRKPAFYYQQVATIPYRRADIGMEVLLIRSRADKRWTFCQGPLEPGLFAEESAIQIASEQAGVEGHCHAQPMSQMDIEKWGASCQIQVFPLQVFTEHAQWPEQYRQRRWVPIQHAMTELVQHHWLPALQCLQHQMQQHSRHNHRR
ncbi:histidine phosphatase family protein [Bacterioplanes sanyensis]|nr:histidine phosphatase family protein [Bacterioplanes sanyensis]